MGTTLRLRAVTGLASGLALTIGLLVTSGCSGEGTGSGTEIPSDALCQPGQRTCLGNTLNTCSSDGLYVPELDCAGSKVCDATLG